MDRVTVSEAATRLGVTPDAVRQRIRRDTIAYEKTEDGRYYVYLTPQDGRRDSVGDGVRKVLVDRLHNENEWLRRELERKDHLLAMALERIPAIEAPEEAPPEPRESPETGADGSGKGEEAHTPRSDDPAVPWWRRLFGL